MDLLSIIIIGIGLAMDCFAVSISKAMCVKEFHLKNSLKMAFLFGIFQALMPLIGYFAGSELAKYVSEYDHWVAFGLLSLIGGKMLIEGWKPIDPHCELTPDPYRWKVLFTLAIATSIDAFASGIVFATFPDKIWYAIALIGFISFIFSLIGSYIGYRSGKLIKFNVEIIGGIILIGIGIKILLEHTLFQ